MVMLFCFANIWAVDLGNLAYKQIMTRAKAIVKYGDGQDIDRGEFKYFEEIARNANMDPRKVQKVINLTNNRLLSLAESITLQELVIKSMLGISTAFLSEEKFFENLDALDSDIMYYATIKLSEGGRLDLKKQQYLANTCCILCTELTKATIIKYIEMLSGRLYRIDNAMDQDTHDALRNLFRNVKYEIALTILHLDDRIKNLKSDQERISVNTLWQVSEMVEPDESQGVGSCAIL
jgi:hypothetical protein